MTVCVRSGTGLYRLIGLSRTESFELRQDGRNNASPVGQPRTNEGPYESWHDSPLSNSGHNEGWPARNEDCRRASGNP